MSELLASISEFIASLNLVDKLTPWRNQEIVWFYLFFPSLILYFVLLSQYLNEKPSIGGFDIIDALEFGKLINPSTKMEVIATNLSWAEGPVWMADDNLPYLLFSDTVMNRIYKWEEGKGFFTVGKTIFVEDSGCRKGTGSCDLLYEPGTNGLVRREETSQDLIACSHGERSILLLRENGTRASLVTHYKGSRLNSPNDLVFSPDGHLYFTDPPYGLMGKDMKPVEKELNHSGIYMVKADYIQMALELGNATAYVRLLDGSLPLPNGLAFSPDFSKLYVSSSEKPTSALYAYDVKDDGSIANRQVFFNATNFFLEECAKSASSQCNEEVGATDGVKVDLSGNVYASGPGGVLIISPEGKLTGRLLIDQPVTNLAFATDGRLYITAKDVIVRLRVKSKGSRIIRRSKA